MPLPSPPIKPETQSEERLVILDPDDGTPLIIVVMEEILRLGGRRARMAARRPLFSVHRWLARLRGGSRA